MEVSFNGAHQNSGLNYVGACSSKQAPQRTFAYTRISDDQVKIVEFINGQVVSEKVVSVAEASQILNIRFKPPKKDNPVKETISEEQQLEKQKELQAKNDKYNEQLALNNKIVHGLSRDLKMQEHKN